MAVDPSHIGRTNMYSTRIRSPYCLVDCKQKYNILNHSDSVIMWWNFCYRCTFFHLQNEYSLPIRNLNFPIWIQIGPRVVEKTATSCHHLILYSRHLIQVSQCSRMVNPFFLQLTAFCAEKDSNSKIWNTNPSWRYIQIVCRSFIS